MVVKKTTRKQARDAEVYLSHQLPSPGMTCFEIPDWKVNPKTKQGVNSTITGTADAWPAYTDIILDHGKLKLTKQSFHVRTLMTHTIHGINASLALDNPYPEILERDETIKKVMREAAKELLKHSGAEYQPILDRLRAEGAYASALAVLVSFLLLNLISQH
jgi:hypothetical protein